MATDPNDSSTAPKTGPGPAASNALTQSQLPRIIRIIDHLGCESTEELERCRPFGPVGAPDRPCQLFRNPEGIWISVDPGGMIGRALHASQVLELYCLANLCPPAELQPPTTTTPDPLADRPSRVFRGGQWGVLTAHQPGAPAGASASTGSPTGRKRRGRPPLAAHDDDKARCRLAAYQRIGVELQAKKSPAAILALLKADDDFRDMLKPHGIKLNRKLIAAAEIYLARERRRRQNSGS